MYTSTLTSNVDASTVELWPLVRLTQGDSTPWEWLVYASNLDF